MKKIFVLFKKQQLNRAKEIFKEEGFFRLIWIGFCFLFKDVYVRFFKRYIIKNIIEFKSNNVDEVVGYATEKYLRAFKPIQIKEEFVQLLELFKQIKPKHVMEIGTANGGTLFCFAKLAPEGSKIISVDLPPATAQDYPSWKEEIYKSFGYSDKEVILIRGDSHKQETLEEVKKILGDNQLDFLFTDGDHSYEGVKKDFEMYGPLVKKGGVIAFHDIKSNIDDHVAKFWNEIKNVYSYKEIVNDYSQNWAGIGIIFK